MKKASLAILLSAIIFSGVFTCNSVQAITTNSTNNTKVIAMRGESRPTLRRGSRGEIVKAVQRKLVIGGYYPGKYDFDSVADGIFGKETEEAVKRFQRDCGLKADGIVGPQTWAAFDKYYPE